MPERTFDKELMLEVLYCKEGTGFEDDQNPGVHYKVLKKEQIDTRRWVSSHELVFQVTENGNTSLWSTTYERGLTEHQDTYPWDDEDEVTAQEVRAVEKTITVTEYELVT
jgi:hypothetical protein